MVFHIRTYVHAYILYLGACCLFVLKCLWKLTRKILEILTTINVEELFLDLDKFFVYYTSLTTAASDVTPFRTVKTIIYHIVNIMSTRVRNCISGLICSLSSPPVTKSSKHCHLKLLHFIQFLNKFALNVMLNSENDLLPMYFSER